jgi:hypothetical protein
MSEMGSMKTGLPLYVVLRFKRTVPEKTLRTAVTLSSTSAAVKQDHQQRQTLLFPECLVEVNATSFHWCEDSQKACSYLGFPASTRVVQDIQNRSKTSADYIYAVVPWDYLPVQVNQGSQLLAPWTVKQLSTYLAHGLMSSTENETS